MAQGQVSLDGVTHTLPAPFSVIATQNPLDLSGTYPLPDSQLDRFLFRISLGHLTPEVETELLMTRRGDPLHAFAPIASSDDLAELQAAADRVSVSKDLADYLVRFAGATRQHSDIERGISTRAVLSVMAAARAAALWEGRDFVTPGDVRLVLVPALSHRLLLRTSAQGAFARDEAAQLLIELTKKVPAPR
jgi:MoxR-like ATPase